MEIRQITYETSASHATDAADTPLVFDACDDLNDSGGWINVREYTTAVGVCTAAAASGVSVEVLAKATTTATAVALYSKKATLAAAWVLGTAPDADSGASAGADISGVSFIRVRVSNTADAETSTVELAFAR